jgi:hypothetical protein
MHMPQLQKKKKTKKKNEKIGRVNIRSEAVQRSSSMLEM